MWAWITLEISHWTHCTGETLKVALFQLKDNLKYCSTTWGLAASPLDVFRAKMKIKPKAHLQNHYSALLDTAIMYEMHLKKTGPNLDSSYRGVNVEQLRTNPVSKTAVEELTLFRRNSAISAQVLQHSSLIAEGTGMRKLICSHCQFPLWRYRSVGVPSQCHPHGSKCLLVKP